MFQKSKVWALAAVLVFAVSTNALESLNVKLTTGDGRILLTRQPMDTGVSYSYTSSGASVPAPALDANISTISGRTALTNDAIISGLTNGTPVFVRVYKVQNNLIKGFGEASVTPVRRPVLVEARYIDSRNYLELHWSLLGVTSAPSASTGAGGNRLTGAGGSLNFAPSQATDRNNFVVRIGNTTIAQSSSPPFYWYLTNHSLHGARINQHMTTLILSAAPTAAQLNQIRNGEMTVEVTGNIATTEGQTVQTGTRHPVVFRPYYDKEVRTSFGMRVRGSEFVDMRTVQETARKVDVVCAALPQAVRANMANSNTFTVFGPGEHSYNIPEHRNIVSRDNWNRAEGYGGRTAATTAANVWRNHVAQVAWYPSGYASGYRDESIFAHELGHGILDAFNAVYNSTHPLRQEMRAAFENARTQNFWTPYIRDDNNNHEYFATLMSIWFNGMSNGNSSNCNTRELLFIHDRKTYDFFAKIMPHDIRFLSPSWSTVAVGNSPSWRDSDPFTSSQRVLVTRPIAAIPALPAITVSQGTTVASLNLPAMVQIDFTQFLQGPTVLAGTNNSGTTGLPVTWNTSNYNGNVPGTYTIQGTVGVNPSRPTAAITNPNNLRASIAVTVGGGASSSSATPSSSSVAPSSSSATPSSSSVTPSSSSSMEVPSSSSITPSSSSSDGQGTFIIANPKIGAIGVQAKNNAIILQNVPQNAKVEVYNLQGKLIYKATPYSPLPTPLSIQVQKGMYIIKVDKQTLRVVVQ
jgi:hypothetical protein